jgi:hypothetical protein
MFARAIGSAHFVEGFVRLPQLGEFCTFALDGLDDVKDSVLLLLLQRMHVLSKLLKLLLRSEWTGVV